MNVRHHRRLVATIVVAIALSATVATASSPSFTQPAVARSGANRVAVAAVPRADLRVALLMVDLINVERARRGLTRLTWNDRVDAAARAHSDDMAAHRTMQHAGTDGSDAGDRLTREGFVWRTWAENIAAGQQTDEAVLADWMASTGHRANLLGNFNLIGVGATATPDGVPYWTIVLAS